jgi:8-oxo-dGTP pyrophosphatase MutT (NUDIX family)
MAALAQPPGHWREAGGMDGHGRALKRAGVLIALVERDGGIHVVLTRRSDGLRDHAGQISFPGGRIESRDASPEATALRETREEIGVAIDDLELLGYLPAYLTGTGFVVLPTVARLCPSAVMRPCPIEVAEIFEVPLGFILDARNHQPHVVANAGCHYRLAAIPYGDYFIWGATAGMLMTLYSYLTGQKPVVDPQGEPWSRPHNPSAG